MQPQTDNNNNDNNNDKNNDEGVKNRIRTASTDISSLDRVFHRLAMIDTTERLQTVLDKLLPRLLKRVGDNNHSIQELKKKQKRNQHQQKQQEEELQLILERMHGKLVEIFSHIMRRVRDDQGCKLPCYEILQLLLISNNSTSSEGKRENTNSTSTTSNEGKDNNSIDNQQQEQLDDNEQQVVVPKANRNVDPFTINLSLAFMTLGLPRCDYSEVESMLPGLVACQIAPESIPLLEQESPSSSTTTSSKISQSHQLAHLLLRSIERLVHDDPTPLRSLARNDAETTTTTTTTNAIMNRIRNGAISTGSSSLAKSPIEIVRILCRDDPLIAATVYDLLLDVLLYHPVISTQQTTNNNSNNNNSSNTSASNSSGIPPNGLSQTGHERLISGQSITARNWVAEMAPSKRLSQLKIAILDFITPNRRWGIFLSSTTAAKSSSNETSSSSSMQQGTSGVVRRNYDEKKIDDDNTSSSPTTSASSSSSSSLWCKPGVTRTVALLVVATGDTTLSGTTVAERARTYLKIYMDSFREFGGNSSGGGGDTTNNNKRTSRSSSSLSISPLGDPIALASELLILSLGQTLAESVVLSSIINKKQRQHRDSNRNGDDHDDGKGNKNINSSNSIRRLGWTEHLVVQPQRSSSTSPTSQQQEQQPPSHHLKSKRRPVAQSVSGFAMSFVANRIFDDHPHIFALYHREQDDGPDRYNNEINIRILGSLTIRVANRALNHIAVTGTTSGLTVLRAKPYMSGADLLNSWSVRISTFCDSIDDEEYDNHQHNDEKSPQSTISFCLNLMAEALSTACAVLGPVSALHRTSSTTTTQSSSSTTTTTTKLTTTTTTPNDGNIAIRDACYGIICTLSRSQRFSHAPHGRIFRRGVREEASDNNNNHPDTSSSSPPSSPSTAGATTASVETAMLLFACAAKEEEILRPRAVAALDALLGAYQRVYAKTTINNDNIGTATAVVDADPVNPWAQPTVSDAKMMSGSGRIQPFTPDQPGPSKALLPLIWTAAQSYQPKASRVAAARWASDVLMTLDLSSACHVLCFVAGDSDVTASTIARQALGLAQEGERRSGEDPTAADSTRFPDFADYVELLFSTDTTNTQLIRRQRYWDFSFQGKTAAIRYGLQCLLNDFYGGDDQAIGVYLSILTETLAVFMPSVGNKETVHGKASMDLLDECSASFLATVSASKYARIQVARQDATFGLKQMETLSLQVSSPSARRSMASACGQVYRDLSLWLEDGKKSEIEFERWIQGSRLDNVLLVCANNVRQLEQNHFPLRLVHGSAFLGAQSICSFRLAADRVGVANKNKIPDQLWEYVEVILASLGGGALHADEIIGNACADGISMALSYDGLDAPVLDPHLYDGCALCLKLLGAAVKKFGHGDSVSTSRTHKLVHASGVCLAATTTGAGVAGTANPTKTSIELGPSRLDCVEKLFELLGSTSYREEEEVALTVGEALAQYADAFSPDDAVWSHSEMQWPSTFDEESARELPPHEQVLYVLLYNVLKAASPHKRTACAPALLAVVTRAAKGVHSTKTYSNRALVRSVIRHLEDVQDAFVMLLSDYKIRQLSRESCCLGLAACRGVVSAQRGDGHEITFGELNSRLLRAFGQSTKFFGSIHQETRAQAEQRRNAERTEISERRRDERTESTVEADNRGSAPSEYGREMLEAFGAQSEISVGGASGVAEAALGAYKEMASVSVAIGREDILYSLLMLSVSHPFWLSPEARDRYGPASLLGDRSFEGNASKMRDALRPYLGKLIPKVLRACHDPSKLTSSQMSALWVGLTGGGAESREAISQHLLTTIDALVEESRNKLWRTRVGACGALAEILSGRDWKDLGGGGAVLSDDDLFGGPATAGVRLLRLWGVSMRAVDDIRGAVRDSGENCARAVRGLTIRLCNPSNTDKKGGPHFGKDLSQHELEACAAAATSLRWLIKHGMSQRSAVAAGICISTLVEVVGVVPPRILKPILPDLLRSLLLAISGLEPAALSYLQLRVDDQEGLERVRLQLAQIGPLAMAVTKCLELLPQLDIVTQQDVVPQLDSALRLSVGFATRAATADATSILCSTCPNAFRFPGTSTNNPSVRLLRAFYFASERERGVHAKDKMVHALGTLAAFCPGSSVRSLALRACERYTASTGNHDDPATRRAAAAALRAIAVRASNQFSDGGASNVWARRVLPVAFLGRKDSDEKIASLWKEVWAEGGAAASLPEQNDFGPRMEEKLLSHLVTECVGALNDLSWARRVSAASALSDLCDQGVLSPIPRGKNSTASNALYGTMSRASQRARSCNLALSECIRVLIKPRLWTGKTEVLCVAIKLASKWSCIAPDENFVFGWDERDGSDCPYKPLEMTLGQNENDLFVSDQWFIKGKNADVISGEETDGSNFEKMDTDAENSNINFEECDSVLPGTEEGQSQLDEVMHDVPRTVMFEGFCRFAMEEALGCSGPKTSSSDELLPYRAAAFRGLCDLLGSVPPEKQSDKENMHMKVSEKLITFVAAATEDRERQPPVLLAGAVDALRASLLDYSDGTKNLDVLKLAVLLQAAGGKTQAAWTVRESTALCLAKLASTCRVDALRPQLVTTMMESASYALSDRKFWRVRFAGVTLLHSLVVRVGTSEKSSNSPERQLFLEALLPQKEIMLKLLRSSLKDTEAKVTAMSSDVLSIMAWWP